MARGNSNYPKETVTVIVGVIVLFVLLILRNGGNYYMNYLHQDASRAQFEIDQSYVVLISQAEGFSQPKPEDKELYNETLVRQFREKFVEKPTFLGKNDFDNAKSFVFHIPTVEDKAINKLLRDKREGFFVHCCYFDSDSLSKASELRIARGWESLIMEGDPKTFEVLRSQARTYSIVNAILSEKVNYSLNSLSETLRAKKESVYEENHVLIDGAMDGNVAGPNTTIVPDFPLTFVAKTFGRTEVDILILKAKGKELSILKAIVLEDCKIHIIKVDLGVYGEAIIDFLAQNGYKKYDFPDSTGSTNEAIFYAKQALSKQKIDDVLPLLEQLRKAKLDKQNSSQFEQEY